MTELHFADIEIGATLPPIETTITQEIIDRAALTHLDFNPVHTNTEWAARARVFGTEKTVAHGMFTMSQMASVIERGWGNQGAVIRHMEAKFTKPVPVEQTVRYEGSVWELHPRNAGQSFVVITVKATDADGSTVGVGTFRVCVPD